MKALYKHKRMRSRDSELNSYWGTVCTPLEMPANDGKKVQKKGQQSTN
jgi:hypothetical protein